MILSLNMTYNMTKRKETVGLHVMFRHNKTKILLQIEMLSTDPKDFFSTKTSESRMSKETLFAKLFIDGKSQRWRF